MEEEEIWKPIPGYSGYEASSLGRIRSVDRIQPLPTRHGRIVPRRLRGKIIKHRDLNGRGYRSVGLYRGTIPQTTSVHRLVCLAFYGPSPLDGATVNHKNFIKHDNRLANLEWLTIQQNAAHAAAAGRNNKRSLSEEDVAFIRFWVVRSKNKANGTGRIVAKILGISHHVVTGVYNRRTYKYLP